MSIGIIARRTITSAFAIVVALSVATLAHAQVSAKTMGPESCSWSSGVIPDNAPSPQRVIVAPSLAAAALIHRVEPEYPADARMEGTVLLCAIIAKDGTIDRLEYVSGPVLLVKATIDAVKQWRYKRTVLNGKPVEVETRIFVDFTLKRPASKKRSSSEKSVAVPTK